MPPKLKSDTAYDLGKRNENLRKFNEARTEYEKAGFIGFLAIARMHLEKKYSSILDRQITDIEYIEQALKILDDHIDDKPASDAHIKHKEITDVRKVLNNLQMELTKEWKQKKFYVLARLTNISKDKRDYIQELKFLIEAIKCEDKKAFIRLQESIIKMSGDIEVRKKYSAYVFNLVQEIKLHPNENSQLAVAVYKLLITLNGDTREKLLEITVFSQLSEDDKRIISEYDFSNLKQDLIFCAKRAIRDPLKLTVLLEIFNFLKKENAIDESDVDTVITYLFNSEEIQTEDKDIEENLLETYCILGQYKAELNPSQAIDLFKKGILKLSKEHPNHQAYLNQYTELLQKSGNLSELNELRQTNNDAASLEQIFNEAKVMEDDYSKTKNIESLKESIKKYKLCAMKGSVNAISKIKRFHESKIPEATHAYAELIKSNPAQFKKTHKQAEATAEALYKEARGQYENLLRDFDKKTNLERKDIYRTIGELRYSGQLFKQNLHLAREFFKKAVELDDQQALYLYAKMCFYGEGGPVDINLASELVERDDFDIEDIEHLYLRAEIIYLHYLNASDNKAENLNACKESCIELFYQGALKGHAASLQSLYILSAYDKEPLATQKLAELYHKNYEKIPLLSNIILPGVIGHPSQYYLQFYKQLSDHDEYPIDPSILELIEEQSLSQLTDETEFNFELEKIVNDYAIHENIDEYQRQLKVNTDKKSKRATFLLAKLELQKNNPKPLRDLFSNEPNSEYDAEIVELLTNYYKNKEKNIEILSNILCYEAQRHAWDSPICFLLRKILSNLDERYKNYKYLHFKELLQKAEQEQKSYFDECASDDSDMEGDNTYQGQDKHVTVDYPRTEELVAKLDSIAEKALNELKRLKHFEEEQYSKKVDEYKALFTSAVDAKFKAKAD